MGKNAETRPTKLSPGHVEGEGHDDPRLFWAVFDGSEWSDQQAVADPPCRTVISIQLPSTAVAIPPHCRLRPIT